MHTHSAGDASFKIGRLNKLNRIEASFTRQNCLTGYVGSQYVILISPNKNAGFPHFFSCNFLSGVVISRRTTSPVLLARLRGGQSRGIFLSGERAISSEALLFSPQFSKPVHWHRDLIQKEDTRSYGKRKEDDKDATHD